MIWATGYRRDYPWLRVPVLDGSGEIRQVDGRTPAPGVFVLGMPNQTRRSSTFLDGVGFDAELVADALLDTSVVAMAPSSHPPGERHDAALGCRHRRSAGRRRRHRAAARGRGDVLCV